MRHPLALAVLPLLGCNLVTHPTPGELGVAEFAYNDGLLGCAFGCDADEPLAVGARATVLVLEGDTLGSFHLRSDAPDVLAVTEIEGEVPGWPSALVQGLADGEAGLVVEDERGVIDILRMQVRDIDQIVVTLPEVESALLLTEGREIELRVDLLDREGQELAGVGALDWKLDDLEPAPVGDPLQLILEEVIDQTFFGTSRERVDLAAGGTGSSGVVQAQAVSGARLGLPVEVVSPDVIATIDLEVVGRPKAGEPFWIEARGFTAEGEHVYDPACVWSLDPGRTRVTSVVQSDTATQLQPDRMGRMRVTCTMGDIEARKTVWVLE